ncbi:MAG: hypothetical protein KatS3mg061_0087 [Dehalococcoidia bacterium]|nr:MAG: hypothetical protein KatS3mg061_0087 [Dehalococcoidia bacterium]
MAARSVSGFSPSRPSPAPRVNQDPTGLIKIVVDAASDRVLGVHMLAEEAGEAIYAATLALRFGATRQDLVETLAPYLTFAEGIRLAAQAVERDPAKMSCCA